MRTAARTAAEDVHGAHGLPLGLQQGDQTLDDLPFHGCVAPQEPPSRTDSVWRIRRRPL